MSLTRYRHYKPSGSVWLADVPSHWEVKRLRRGVRLNTEKTDRRQRPVALENIESWSGKFRGSDGDLSGEGVAFEPGDLLFGKLRPYLAKAFYADFAGEAVGDFHVLRPFAGISGRFLQYQLLSPDFISIVDGATFGAKMPRVGWDFMGDVAIVQPPMAEQLAISRFLDRETARIDKLIEAQERLIELLNEKRQAVTFHAVTRGLNPNAPMKPSNIGWLGGVPEHWEVVRVKWIARMESGHTPDKKIERYWEGADIPWVSLSDTAAIRSSDFISDTAYQITQAGIDNSSARLLPAGAVVFSRDATIGCCAITSRPMAVSQHFIAWLAEDRLMPEFLLRVFRAMGQELERRATGATVKTIGMTDVRELTMALPPKREQVEIVTAIRERSGQVDRLIEESTRAITLLKERRGTLISAAVTGDIDVRELAPAEAA